MLGPDGQHRAGRVPGLLESLAQKQRARLLVLARGVFHAFQVVVEHVGDNLAHESGTDVDPISLPDPHGERQGGALVAREIVDLGPLQGRGAADGAQDRFGIAVGDAHVLAAEGGGHWHRRGGQQDLRRGVARPHHVDRGQHVGHAGLERQDLAFPAVLHGPHGLLGGGLMDVEARLPVAPGLVQPGRHHYTIGGEGRRDDIEDVLPPLHEPFSGHWRAGQIQVEQLAVADLEGQGLAVGPDHLGVPVGDGRGPLQTLAKARRVEFVHRPIGLAAPLGGGEAEVHHGDPASQRCKVAFDVAREATADGEHPIAALNAEARFDLWPDVPGEVGGHVGPARLRVAGLQTPGLCEGDDMASRHGVLTCEVRRPSNYITSVFRAPVNL